MALHVCKCGHHGFSHGQGWGGCHEIVPVKNPKKGGPRKKNCPCSGFKPEMTLAEYMDKAHAA